MNQPTRNSTPALPQPSLARPRAAQQTGRQQHTTRTGVPLSVWLTEPLAGCCPVCESPISTACAHRLPTGLATQIVEAFTAPGDLVYVSEAGNAACLVAAVRSGRKVLAHAPTHHDAARAYDTLHTQAVQVASLAVLRRGAPGGLTRPPGRRRVGPVRSVSDRRWRPRQLWKAGSSAAVRPTAT